MVTVGRVVFAAIKLARAPHDVPRPAFLLAVTFGLIALLPTANTGAASSAFGVAGLGCSALLPLTIGFGQEELFRSPPAVAGGVIAFYQVGYGLAAFGVGPLLDGGVGLPTIYGVAAIVGPRQWG